MARHSSTALRGSPPSARPYAVAQPAAIAAAFERALVAGDGEAGAHCIHELWMRGAHGGAIDTALSRLWTATAGQVPEWLPTQHVPWLPQVYEVAAGFRAARRGRSHVYLVLLDFSDRRGEPLGLYVGQSTYPALRRFEQHKAGIRAAGSVLKRGLEVLTGPVLHLTRIAAPEARRIEGALATALADAGLKVEGGH
jgi:hypothetical protein